MTAIATFPGAEATPRPPTLWGFVGQEYQRLMRSRVATVIIVMLAYTLIMLPFVLANPQPAIGEALAKWFGSDRITSKVIIFFWTDGAMSKFAAVMGPILAGGIMIDERSRNLLDVLLSKPVRPEDYFLAKLTAAWAAMATFYGGAVAIAALTFPMRLPGFVLHDFLALCAMHGFAVLFAITFSAWMAVTFNRKLTALMVSFLVLSMLVAFSFMGFYYPPLRLPMYLNPFYHGVSIIAKIGTYGWADILGAIAAIVAANAVVAVLGRRAAAKFMRRT
jgi:ABC-2 type transport system permease protein